MLEEKVIKVDKRQFAFWKALVERQVAIRQHIREGKPLSEIPNIKIAKPF